MLYRLSSAESTGDPTTYSGRRLAAQLRLMPTSDRAFLGYGLWSGAIELVHPTLAQTSTLVNASVPYIRAAGAIADQTLLRAAVLAGHINLLDAARSVRPSPAPIDRVWSAASPVQQTAFVREHADELWTLFDAVTA